ncbi:hypothetical protein [Novosphingobium sp. FSW06-99]|uniref:hypothetical protein n=1 Tax=Novosphingobium sp. FSW06-99 TaxID=1739113 RepID=UPI0012E3D033|nr:hypothetical protein [Novosphingobium sp. FSW06-99]
MWREIVRSAQGSQVDPVAAVANTDHGTPITMMSTAEGAATREKLSMQLIAELVPMQCDPQQCPAPAHDCLHFSGSTIALVPPGSRSFFAPRQRMSFGHHLQILE